MFATEHPGAGGSSLARHASSDDVGDLAAWLGPLFPPGVIIEGGGLHVAGDLFAEELARIARAVPRRRSEFRAGRLYARRALSQLGVPPAPLLVGPDRGPSWPPGVVGSISHSGGGCVAVVAKAATVAGLGVDLEVRDPLPADLIAMVCDPGELRRRDELEHLLGVDVPKLLFSIKEAVFKAYFPRTSAFLEFQDVSVRLEPAHAEYVALISARRPSFPPGRRIVRGAYEVGAQFVAASALFPGLSSADEAS